MRIHPHQFQLAIYQDRYKDASDFTFIFVGDVNVEEMKALIAVYLGSLPALNRKETFKDNKVDMRQGVDKNEFVRKQETAKAVSYTHLPIFPVLQQLSEYNAKEY